MPPSPTALVPLRALGAGKSRLAAMLAPEQRAELAAAMFADVVDALAASSVAEVVVAAGNDAAAEAARSRGLRVVADPAGARSLDAALAAASATIGRREALVIVAADLPLLTADDVDEVLDLPAPVVIAPTRDGGTGALLRRPSDCIATAYGPGSAAAHGRLAQAAGLAAASVARRGFHHDVDTWSDLLGLASTTPGPHTARVLPGFLETPASAR